MGKCGDNCACSSNDRVVDFTAVDQTKCPLCGGENNCSTEVAKQTGEPEQPCWCRDVTFTAELLATVPDPAKCAACVCRNCAEVASN